MDTGEFDLALADFAHAVALDPRSMAAWGGKAAALRALGRLNEAIAATRAALALEPEDFLTHRTLALLYADAGQLDEARRWALSARARVGPEGWAELDELVARIDAARATPGPDR